MKEIELVIKIHEEQYEFIKQNMTMDAVKNYPALLYDILERIANGIPFHEIYDKENSEIKNEINLLSKRVETLEKQMKEDKEEQLKKLESELEYAKFCCALPTIMDMMSHKNGN